MAQLLARLRNRWRGQRVEEAEVLAPLTAALAELRALPLRRDQMIYMENGDIELSIIRLRAQHHLANFPSRDRLPERTQRAIAWLGYWLGPKGNGLLDPANPWPSLCVISLMLGQSIQDVFNVALACVIVEEEVEKPTAFFYAPDAFRMEWKAICRGSLAIHFNVEQPYIVTEYLPTRREVRYTGLPPVIDHLKRMLQ